MDVFGLGIRLQEEGSAAVTASLKKLAGEVAATALTIGTITMGLKKFIDETAESQRVQAQLATALRSTNGVSGQTIETLNAQASALMQVTAFGDEAIGSAQALLLTFTNVRKVFPEATRATLDLAQALGMDARSAAMMLGKALNDPVSGITALRRAGVQLSEVQKKQIEDAVKANDLLTAQRIILSELSTQVGGSAEAYRKTLGGALAGLREAFGNLFEASDETGRSMIAAINGFTKVVTDAQPVISGVFSLLVKAVSAFGTTTGVIFIGLGRAIIGLGALIVNVLLTPLSLLPVVGGKIAAYLDELNTKVNENDKYFSDLQETLKDYRAMVAVGTEETKKFNDALSDTPTGGPGGGGGGLDQQAEIAARRFEEYSALAARRAGEEYKAQREREARARAEARKPKMTDAEYLGIRPRGQPMDLGAVFPTTEELTSFATAAAADIQAFLNSPTIQANFRKLQWDTLREIFTEKIRDGVGAGIRAGLEAALATGNIGNFTKALAQTLNQAMSRALSTYIVDGLSTIFKDLGKSLVKGLANAMADFASKSIVFAKMMEAVKSFLAFGNGLGAIIAAVALLSFANANGGRASMGSTSVTGGAGGLQYGMNASNASTLPTQQIIFGATSATTAAGMTPRSATNVTIIGPNDPSAQRAIQELLAKADSRGRLG